MKKFFEFLDVLYENGSLEFLAIIITVAWYGYVGHLINTYSGVFAKVFYVLWLIVSILIWLIRKSNKN